MNANTILTLIDIYTDDVIEFRLDDLTRDLLVLGWASHYKYGLTLTAAGEAAARQYMASTYGPRQR